ncbi:CRISPR system precrRNA processing endoribonuclease RAMP protein Cas6 [Tengunoibacter tsumagoiensis]|uniref:Uncharacterized protein n=1 Tax=Tengunoibacter tsumagoiensis TaxID=2014871 RepID=A0A401ZZT7_9CHLR|nr:CRISPR system precrRNA processing endoribonuclease RAMP protein Cas6 [Tengunoibacter tsumagoiensis]GCE12400.1 hypothetical protein KTT_22590 [Tengunoibacter tsumagoiensis]
MVSRERIAAPTRLYALLLRIRPVQAGTLMAFSGEFAHGAFLRWLGQVMPDVSAWLHDGNKRRLFTCSSLQFDWPEQRMLYAERENVHLPLDPQKTYVLRITLLLGELFPLLHEALIRYYPNQHETTQHFLQLGKQRFTLEEVILTPSHPSGQCGITSLTTLIEQAQQMSHQTLKHITLNFTSLTTFNRYNNAQGYGPHYAVLPLPHYVFPNLAKRWEDIAPPELVGHIERQTIEEYTLRDGIIITDYDLHPHHIHLTRQEQPGFLGRCTYRVRDTRSLRVANDRDKESQNENGGSLLSLPQQIWVLSQLAFYTGIGYKTSMGLGRAQVI